jgi:hypothetical protein
MALPQSPAWSERLGTKALHERASMLAAARAAVVG